MGDLKGMGGVRWVTIEGQEGCFCWGWANKLRHLGRGWGEGKRFGGFVKKQSKRCKPMITSRGDREQGRERTVLEQKSTGVKRGGRGQGLKPNESDS